MSMPNLLLSPITVLVNSPCSFKLNKYCTVWRAKMYKLKLVISSLVISLITFGSVNAEEDAETRLLETNKCVECDLNNAELEGAQLRRADFSGAYLYRANLEYADLRGANFTGADLSNARLRVADLRNAIFNGAMLKYTNFGDADLSGASFVDAKLRGASFANT